MKRLALSIVLVLTFAACNKEMEPRSKISKFRILAVKSQPVQIVADTGIELSALFAAPYGKDAEPVEIKGEAAWITINPSWNPLASIIPDFLIETVPMDSDGEARLEEDVLVYSSKLVESIAAFGSEADLSVPVYLLGCNNGEIDTEILEGRIQEINETSRIANLEEACTGKGSEPAVAFKTLEIFIPEEKNECEYDTTLNTNPKIEFLAINDSRIHPPSSPPGETGTIECKGSGGCRDPVMFQVRLTPSSFDYYCDYFGNLRNEMETSYISWYCDGGEFSSSRIRSDYTTEARKAAEKGHVDKNGEYILDLEEVNPLFTVEWLPPVEGGQYHMWVAARDLRGGTGWSQYNIEVLDR